MFLHIKITLKKLHKILQGVIVAGIAVNTVMLVHNVVNDYPANLILVNFLSSIALFIGLAHSRKRNENGN
jgi:hypothetical protein